MPLLVYAQGRGPWRALGTNCIGGLGGSHSQFGCCREKSLIFYQELNQNFSLQPVTWLLYYYIIQALLYPYNHWIFALVYFQDRKIKFVCVAELHGHTHCASGMLVTFVQCTIEHTSLGRRKIHENDVKI
jgi:hypothetical protein